MKNSRRMVDEYDNPIDNASSFKEMVDNKRAYIAEGLLSGKRKYYPLQKIAEALGMSKEMLQKRINKEKPASDRDFVIGLCAVLGMNSCSTDEAIEAYSRNMVPLNEPYERDYLIMKYLDGLEDDMGSIADLNHILEQNNYPSLNVIEHRNTGVVTVKKKQVVKRPYRVLRRYTQVYGDEGDMYDSLSTAFDYRYECVSVMVLEGTTIDRTYTLHAHAKGYHYTLDITTNEQSTLSCSSFCTPTEAGEFADYFTELLALAKKEQKRILDIMNDSRNYRGRLSANNRNNGFALLHECDDMFAHPADDSK